ncbi:hypothetical protein [Rodentibacter trehalosifermentans]|uniref:hypothetical protein n=1 Tax=Rodentibacter trehalosifermentans TaxID=1908263 RepID=UPI0009841EA3|nr:hypothetical protein [Rodentibacter trehalosifermentans]OOF47215.1 hypothetical protein BKK53_11465 [Rodentibacter trehalosifermentans]
MSVGNSRFTGKSAVEMRGVSLHSDGKVDVVSEGNIDILESRQQERLSEATKWTHRGAFQSKTESGKLDNRFDKDKVQKELDLQREVTESFGKTVTETGTLIADKVSEAARKKKYEAAIELEQAQNALKENDSEINRTLLSQAKANFDSANKEAKEWETGGSQRRILDSALNVLSTALGGRPVAEVIASGLSPTVNHRIKEATKRSIIPSVVGNAGDVGISKPLNVYMKSNLNLPGNSNEKK